MAKQAGTYFSLVLPNDVRAEVEASAADNGTSKAAALVAFARMGIRDAARGQDGQGERLTKADLAEVVQAIAAMQSRVLEALPAPVEDVEAPEIVMESYGADDIEAARAEGREEGAREVRQQVLKAWGAMPWLGKLFAGDLLSEIVELPKQNPS